MKEKNQNWMFFSELLCLDPFVIFDHVRLDTVIRFKPSFLKIAWQSIYPRLSINFVT